MRYYFIHGSGDVAATDARANTLDNYIPNMQRLSYFAADTYEISWESLLTQTEEADNNSVFIGESMGGFWATLLARVKYAHCYLLNPASYPAWEMVNFVGQALNSTTPLTKEQVGTFAAAPDVRDYMLKGRVHIMLGRNDDIVSPYGTANFYTKFCEPVWVDDGHVISDGNLKTVAETVLAIEDEGGLALALRKVRASIDYMGGLFSVL